MHVSIFERLGVIDDVISGLFGQDLPDTDTEPTVTTDEPDTPALEPEPEPVTPTPDGDLTGGWDRDRVGRFGLTLADKFGLRLSSLYRTPEQNRRAGGARRSDHLTGMALDLAGDASKTEMLYRWAKQNEGPGKLFRIVLYKYERADHRDHVHLSFNADADSVVAGMAEQGRQQTKAAPSPDKVKDRLAIIDGILRGHRSPAELGRAYREKHGGGDYAGTLGLGAGSGGRAPREVQLAEGDKGTYQKYARDRLAQYGWSDADFAALVDLWNKESGWNPRAQNPTSTAYGIAQFLNSTWGGVGFEKSSDYRVQIDAGLAYIKRRYGSPQAALAFWNRRRYY